MRIVKALAMLASTLGFALVLSGCSHVIVGDQSTRVQWHGQVYVVDGDDCPGLVKVTALLTTAKTASLHNETARVTTDLLTARTDLSVQESLAPDETKEALGDLNYFVTTSAQELLGDPIGKLGWPRPKNTAKFKNSLATALDLGRALTTRC